MLDHVPRDERLDPLEDLRLLEGGQRQAEALRPQQIELRLLEARSQTSAPGTQADPPRAALREQHAFERMLTVLCEHIALLIRESRRLGRLDSKEASLQLEAFEERRARALAVVTASREEPWELRIHRCEQQLEALECSRSYFASAVRATSSSPAGEPCL